MTDRNFTFPTRSTNRKKKHVPIQYKSYDVKPWTLHSGMLSAHEFTLRNFPTVSDKDAVAFPQRPRGPGRLAFSTCSRIAALATAASGSWSCEKLFVNNGKPPALLKTAERKCQMWVNPRQRALGVPTHDKGLHVTRMTHVLKRLSDSCRSSEARIRPHNLI